MVALVVHLTAFTSPGQTLQAASFYESQLPQSISTLPRCVALLYELHRTQLASVPENLECCACSGQQHVLLKRVDMKFSVLKNHLATLLAALLVHCIGAHRGHLMFLHCHSRKELMETPAFAKSNFQISPICD